MKNAILLTCALIAPAFAVAAEQTDSCCDKNSNSKLHFMKPTAEQTEILQRTRPYEPRRASAPKFVIGNPDNNNFMMTLGGQLNVVVGGDIGNDLYKQPGAGISFVTSQIPVPAVQGKKGDFYINPINGFVDLQLVGLGNTKNEITGYLKFGTNGITTSLALQRAYVSWRGLTAGMKLTLFQDDYACQPPTIDPEGPSGCVSTVSYELSYKSKSYNGFRFAAGLDMPTYYTSNGYYRGPDFLDPNSKNYKYDESAYKKYTDKQVSLTDYDQNIPDVPLWAEYSFSQWNRIRVSGIVRNFLYKDLLTNKTRDVVGWGVMLSGNVQPASKWILYYQVAYGAGIGNYIQDIAGHPYSFIPSEDHLGQMKASPMMGANIGVTFNATKKLQFNAMASEARIWGVGAYANPSVSPDANVTSELEDYKHAEYVAVNCFYNLNSFLQLGVEYLYGRRTTWNMGGANDSRIQAQLSFTF